jgi:hypothetical protein
MSKLRITHTEFINNINKLSINDNEKVFIITLFNKYFELGCRDNFYQYDDYLCAELNKTTRTIRRVRKSLQDNRYITCNHISKAGKQIVSYTINFQVIENTAKSISISKPSITNITNPKSKGIFKTSGEFSPVKDISIPSETKVPKIACFEALNEDEEFTNYIEIKTGEYIPEIENLMAVLPNSIEDIPAPSNNENIEVITLNAEDSELTQDITNNEIKNIIEIMDNRKYYDTRYNYDYSTQQVLNLLERCDIDAINAIEIKFEDNYTLPTTIDDIDLVVRYHCMYYLTKLQEYKDYKAQGQYALHLINEMQEWQYKCIYDTKDNIYWDKAVEIVAEYMNINHLNYTTTTGSTQQMQQSYAYSEQEMVNETPVEQSNAVEVITPNTLPDYYPECAGDIPDEVYNEITNIVFKEIFFELPNEVGITNKLKRTILRDREEMKPLYKAYLNQGLYEKSYLKHCFKLAYDDIMLDKDRYTNVA